MPTSVNRVFSVLACVAAIATLATGVRASGPAFWIVGTASEFLKGTSDGVYVTSDGIVTAGPRLVNRLTSTPAQIWSLAVAPDGTAWAGTGGDGRVIRMRSGQPEETVFDAEEKNVFAIAIAGNRVYAATGPDGRVYVIDGTSPARPFFDPEEKYIWALAVDAAGQLWVGAGNPAVIYRVDAAGVGKVIYKPPAAHVVTLAMAGGRMLAGTESPGRLYRFDANDRPYVMLDSSMTELRAISPGLDGVIFASATSRGDDSAAAGGESTSIGLALPPAPGPTSGGTTASASSTARRSVIYRIDANGSWDTFWESPDAIYDIAALGDGGVLAASGPEGRIYKVEPTRQVLLYSGVDAKQITRLVSPLDRNFSVFATANPGRVVSFGPAEQSPATYVSPVRDTHSSSTWGTIRWEASGTVQIYTRSGNTEAADDSWSEWAGPYAQKTGDPIKSPAARFLQWKAVFTHPPAPPLPQLTSVTVAYLPHNSRPVVNSITVHPPGVVFAKLSVSDEGAIAGLDDATASARRPPGDSTSTPPPPGRRMFQKSLQTIAWKAEDADGDRLTYVLSYRREGESSWRELKTDIVDSIFVWDTTSAPDGRYTFKITASDDSSNAADRALTGEMESDPVDVDNTAPVITSDVVRQGPSSKVQVRVRDAQSAILKVEFAIAGGKWQIASPVDGLSDSPDERYEIAVPAGTDIQQIVIRATDALQNTTSQAVR